jgi:hypothetical protein
MCYLVKNVIYNPMTCQSGLSGMSGMSGIVGGGFNPLSVSPLFFSYASAMSGGNPVVITDGAASFASGTGNVLSCSNSSSLQFSNGFTFSCWVQSSSFSASQEIFSKWDGSSSDIIQLQIASTGAIDAFVGGTGGNFGATTSSVITANTWFMITMVFDGTQSTNATRLKVYVNGLSQSLTFTGTIPSSISNTLELYWGNYHNYTGGFGLVGYLDEVSVWNRPLTQSEVTTLYNSGAGLLYNMISGSLLTGLVQYCGCYEQPNTTRYDATSNGNNLAVTGTVGLVAGITSGYAVYNNDPITTYFDLSSNANNATMSTAVNRPVLQTGVNGINGLNAFLYNTTSAYMSVANGIALTGVFTVYVVGTRATSSIFEPLCGTSASGKEAQFVVYLDNKTYFINDSGTGIDQSYTGSTGTIVCRWRRDASNNVWFAATGMAEIQLGTQSGTTTIYQLGSYGTQYNGSGNLHAMQMVVGADLVTTNPGYVTAFQSWINSTWGVNV